MNADMTLTKQWASRPDDQRFLTLDALYESVQERRRGSREIRHDLRELAVGLNEDGDDLRLILPDAGIEDAQFTHYSFGTLCQRVGAPAGFFRDRMDGAPELTAEVLNHCIDSTEREAIMPYVYQNGHTELRAATSPSYGRIYDEEVVRAVSRVNERDNGIWKVPGVLDWNTGVHNPHVDVTKENTTLYASDRDIFLFLVDDAHPVEVGKLPNGEPDTLFRGFYVWNSETGNSSFGMATMYMRAVCANRILWGVENKREITFRHTKGAPERFLAEVRPVLNELTHNNTGAICRGVIEAKKPVLPRDRPDKIKWIMRETGVPQARAIAALNALEREEGRVAESVWDVAQGLTAVARRIPHQDQRVALERAAKKILDKVA